MTLEQVNESIQLIQEILPKLPSSISRLAELQLKHEDLLEQQKRKENNIETFNFLRSVFGVIFIAIAAIVLFENINTNMKYLSILFLVIGLLSLLGNKGKKQTNLPEKDEFINQNDALSEEIENINKQRNQICAQLYLKPENNIYTILNEIKLKAPYWNWSANLLNERLPLLLNNLIKIKTIHEDSTIGPSQKALAISQLFALFNNAVTNTKILNEKQKQSKIMEDQLEEMKKNNREIQAQNDLLT